MRSDLIRIIGKDAAALAQNLVEIIQGFEVFIGNGLVRQKRSAGWIWGE
jgi:hypothetical protein